MQIIIYKRIIIEFFEKKENLRRLRNQDELKY